MNILGKDFFRFLSGFAGIVFISLALTFALGFYESTIADGLDVDTAAPVSTNIE